MTQGPREGDASVRLGTRGSGLARAQAGEVARRLEAAGGGRVELQTVRTVGDRDQGTPLAHLSEPGAFTAALDAALLDGTVDLAVHSLKDLPTQVHPDLKIVAVPPREDPADVLVLPVGTEGTLGSLPRGARVGTSSPRRKSLSLAHRPDLQVEPIRGNVDTRLGKVDDGRYDAIILALAGLRRLGLTHRASGTLEVQEWPPAPGQGALAVVARRDDPRLKGWMGEALDALECSATRAAVEAERAVLHALGAGCSLPVGAVGLPYRNRLRLWAMVLSADGSQVIRTDQTGAQEGAPELGLQVAETLRGRGAMRLLTEAERHTKEAP